MGPLKVSNSSFLFPPGVAIVAGKVGVFLEERIVVGRQHFRVGVYIHAGALGLIQQHFQVLQVMAGNQDTRVIAYADIHGGDFRIAVSTGVGTIQQGHALYAVFTGFQGQGNQIIHGQAVIQGSGQGALQESIYFGVILYQVVGMFAVGRQTFQTIGNHFPQGTDVFVFGGQYANVLSFGIKFAFFPVPQGSFRQAGLIGQLTQQLSFYLQSLFDFSNDGFPIEVGIGDGNEQVNSTQVVYFPADFLAFSTQFGGDGGQAFGHVDQQVLHSSYFRFLAAYAYNRAAFAAGSFLTLKTEHFIFHTFTPLF